MDVSTLNNLEQLKALAYDQIVAKERAEANLIALNRRIVQVLDSPTPRKAATESDDSKAE